MSFAKNLFKLLCSVCVCVKWNSLTLTFTTSMRNEHTTDNIPTIGRRRRRRRTRMRERRKKNWMEEYIFDSPYIFEGKRKRFICYRRKSVKCSFQNFHRNIITYWTMLGTECVSILYKFSNKKKLECQHRLSIEIDS